jgi:hypothetical protein
VVPTPIWEDCLQRSRDVVSDFEYVVADIPDKLGRCKAGVSLKLFEKILIMKHQRRLQPAEVNLGLAQSAFVWYVSF